MGDLLIAGPTALDDHPRQNGLLGGVGLYAAIAAAPLARTQLWSRAGNGINNQLKAIITRHGIDLAGVSWDGPTPHGGPNGFEPGGPLLPDIEPTDAASLGAVLLIGLPPDEWRRAQRVALALTLAGRQLHSELFPIVAQINLDLLKALEPSAVQALDAGLRALQHQAEAMARQPDQPRANRRGGQAARRSAGPTWLG